MMTKSLFLFSLLIGLIICKEVYISNIGVDGITCGTKLLPCATFEYVFGKDQNFNLNDTTVYVQEGVYEISDVYIPFNNVTLQANGTVYLTIHKYAFTIESDNFVIDGFRFSYSTSNHISYFLLNIEEFNDRSSVQSNFVVRNCYFENLNYLGLISADYFSENNGTLKFYNNVISNTNSEFIFDISNINLEIKNVTISNYTSEGIAFKIEQESQGVTVDNVTVNGANTYDLFYMEFTKPANISYNAVTAKNSVQKNNFFYINSRSNITSISLNQISIENSENIYFLVNTNYVSKFSLKNIFLRKNENPTSSVRLDAVFELPNGNFTIDNINFVENTQIFSLIDCRNEKYFSDYSVTNVYINSNRFDNHIYYYDTEYPEGGIVHLSYVDKGFISNVTATNNTGIIQIIGVTEADSILIANCYFYNNTLTNGLAHDIVIMGVPSNGTYGEATIINSTFLDASPVISCYDSYHDFKLTLKNNQFHNNTEPYAHSINTNVNGACKVACDTNEQICGKKNDHGFLVWIIIGVVAAVVVGAIIAFVVYRYKRRSEYETIE